MEEIAKWITVKHQRFYHIDSPTSCSFFADIVTLKLVFFINAGVLPLVVGFHVTSLVMINEPGSSPGIYAFSALRYTPYHQSPHVHEAKVNHQKS